MEENKLTTGQPNNLKSWLENCKKVFGEDSKATKFIKDKISNSANGENEIVVANEQQLLYTLMQIHRS